MSTFKPALMILAVLLLSLSGFAQEGPPPGGPPAGGPPDFRQMRQQFLDRLKKEMEASDDDWKALGPMIEHVQDLQRDSSGMMGLMMLFRPPGGGFPPGGPDGNVPKSVQAVMDLQSTLEKQDATTAEVQQKIAAVRAARDAAKAELTKARQELIALLTQRQEAVLALAGILE